MYITNPAQSNINMYTSYVNVTYHPPSNFDIDRDEHKCGNCGGKNLGKPIACAYCYKNGEGQTRVFCCRGCITKHYNTGVHDALFANAGAAPTGNRYGGYRTRTCGACHKESTLPKREWIRCRKCVNLCKSETYKKRRGTMLNNLVVICSDKCLIKHDINTHAKPRHRKTTTSFASTNQ